MARAAWPSSTYARPSTARARSRLGSAATAFSRKGMAFAGSLDPTHDSPSRRLSSADSGSRFSASSRSGRASAYRREMKKSVACSRRIRGSVRPGGGGLGQRFPGLVVAPLRAQDLDLDERGFRRGRQRGEVVECLARQYVGGAGRPVPALRGSERAGPRRVPAGSGRHGTRTRGSSSRQSGGGMALAFSRSTLAQSGWPARS